MGGFFSTDRATRDPQDARDARDERTTNNSTLELTLEQRQEIANKRLQHLTKSQPKPLRLSTQARTTTERSDRTDYIIRDWLQ